MKFFRCVNKNGDAEVTKGEICSQTCISAVAAQSNRDYDSLVVSNNIFGKFDSPETMEKSFATCKWVDRKLG